MNPLVFLELAGRITDRLVQSPSVPVTPTARPVVVEAVKEAIAADPVLKNELNAENPIQSRVLWGNFIAGIGALPTAIIGLLPILVVLGVIDQGQADIVRDGINSAVQGVGGLVAIGGVVYSAYGRLASGLKPLFSRKAGA
ncbi:hypothetical protein [Microvirga sp. P5_D2]